MNATGSGYSQAELRFFLPLAPGQRIGVLGESKQLLDALAAGGLEITIIPRSANLPLEITETGNAINDLDHLIIPEYSSDCYDPCLSRIVQRLKHGGWLLIGIHNSESLYRTFSKKGTVVQHCFSIRDSSVLLGKNDIQAVHCYGVYDELKHPEILVPLEPHEAACFFFRNILTPATRLAAWTRPIAVLLASIGLQRMLFRDLVIIARRVRGGNSDI
jgi:hypothetical protein